ncbi:MAG: hypothetical protein ACRELT_18585 [Longimicrobiales bacterium]
MSRRFIVDLKDGWGTRVDREFVLVQSEVGEGMYAFVTHSFGDAIKGAAGLIRVGQAAVAAGTH